MASKRNAFSSLIAHGLDPDLFIGFRFHPTYEEGIRIVNIKNTGGELPPIFNEYRGLFQCHPEQLEECHCFTKLELLGKNKVNRTLGGDSRRYWKNIMSDFVTDDNNKKIGWVTKLKLHEDKNTPTEWHILEYRDRKTPDAGRWVLCQIYKREKNNDSGSPSMGASGAYEIGQCSNTQPDSGNMYPNQYSNTNSIDMCPNQYIDSNPLDWGNIYPNQYSNTNSIDMCPNQYINSNPFSGMDDNWNGYNNLNPFSGMDNNRNGDFNPDQHYEVGQCSNSQPDLGNMYPNQYSNDKDDY